MKKWEIANNRTQINKDIVNVLPFIKVWYSKNYFFETGVFTPAFGECHPLMRGCFITGSVRGNKI